VRIRGLKSFYQVMQSVQEGLVAGLARFIAAR
jgi:hypothetical protein